MTNSFYFRHIFTHTHAEEKKNFNLIYTPFKQMCSLINWWIICFLLLLLSKSLSLSICVCVPVSVCLSIRRDRWKNKMKTKSVLKSNYSLAIKMLLAIFSWLLLLSNQSIAFIGRKKKVQSIVSLACVWKDNKKSSNESNGYERRFIIFERAKPTINTRKKNVNERLTGGGSLVVLYTSLAA